LLYISPSIDIENGFDISMKSKRMMRDFCLRAKAAADKLDNTSLKISKIATQYKREALPPTP